MVRRVRVLIVDDEPQARARLRKLLDGEEGVDLLGECENGVDAISVIERDAPDLVFLDVQMPPMDGFHVIEALGHGVGSPHVGHRQRHLGRHSVFAGGGPVLTPQLDPQQTMLAEVPSKLDTALAYVACKSATCKGAPSTVDLWYGDTLTTWLELAHTLKARSYLHTATRGPSAYALALAQADSGISTPAHDLVSWQSSNPNEWNLWYHFMVIDRSGYISAGAFLVNLLKTTNDPRRALYFAMNNGAFTGAPPGGGTGSFSTLSAPRLDPSFRRRW